MQNFVNLLNNEYFLISISLWELGWKGFALWRAARLNKKYWFAALLLINTFGIFPILYLVFTKNEPTNK